MQGQVWRRYRHERWHRVDVNTRPLKTTQIQRPIGTPGRYGRGCSLHVLNDFQIVADIVIGMNIGSKFEQKIQHSIVLFPGNPLDNIVLDNSTFLK